MKTFTFPKSARLCSQKDISELFESGAKSQGVYPLRAVFRMVDAWDDEPKVKVMVSVSKRQFKRAVDRNRVKRQLRELYRLRQHEVAALVPPGKSLHIGWIWIGHKLVNSAYLSQRFDTLLGHVQARLYPLPPVDTLSDSTSSSSHAPTDSMDE